MPVLGVPDSFPQARILKKTGSQTGDVVKIRSI